MINAAENYETPLFIKGLLVIWAIYVLARVYPKIKAREPLTEEEKDLLIALGLITYFFIGSAFVKHPDLDKPTSLPGAVMAFILLIDFVLRRVTNWFGGRIVSNNDTGPLLPK